MLRHFQLMADYNRWANARLYAAVAQLPEERYRADAGVYFKSVHGTLNHLLAGDRIWMHRLQGKGAQPRALDAIQCEEFEALRSARVAEDERIVAYVAALSPADLEAPRDYHTLAGVPQRTPLREILAHFFNHQTHHRGQVHAALTRLGVAEPPPLDLLILQRERAAQRT
jgi:uncharacterized damage-inducible protein DinB